jgi:hypothetical protein
MLYRFFGKVYIMHLYAYADDLPASRPLFLTKTQGIACIFIKVLWKRCSFQSTTLQE